MRENILIQAWKVYKCDGNYYIQYTHAIYLQSIQKIYTEIHLVAPTSITELNNLSSFIKLDKNIKVHELPSSSSYLGAYRNFFSYLKLYRNLKHTNFDTVYSRFPSPFGWLQMFFFKESRIVHHVGDPIDTVLKNDNLNTLFKYTKVFFFIPEYLLFLISSYNAEKVVTNGHHIANKLKKFNVNANYLISTTLQEKDFFEKSDLYSICDSSIKLLYVGYLRKAKGVDVLMKALSVLNTSYPGKFSLTIVGSGEELDTLKKLAIQLNVEVTFTGHIDNRNELNNIMRNHDIFCFASLSEGSPRVILEAIANGLFVITTPVGSLPYIFKDNLDVLYFDYNDAVVLSNRIIQLVLNRKLQEKLRINSLNKVKDLTIDKFIGDAFNV